MVRGGLIGPLPPLGPGSVGARRRSELPFPLAEPNLTLFAWGRSSLHAGLRALGIGAGDEILAPAYHHGSEIEAIVRTGAGCRFYAGTAELEPAESELESMLGPRVRALHLTHFLGFPQRISHWRRWCDERNLLLIEDAAQAWLASADGRPLGSFGDLAMFCLYKIGPVPDGSALVCARPAEQPSRGSGLGASRSATRIGAWIAQRSPGVRRLLSRDRSSEPFDRDAAIELGAAAEPTRITTALLPRLDFERIRARRRRNYARLLDRLGEHVPPPFNRLGEGAMPWLFPVQDPDKRGLLAHLEQHGILATDFWSVGHRSCDPDAAPAVREWRARTVGLPVHQELRASDLERVAAATGTWFARRG